MADPSRDVDVPEEAVEAVAALRWNERFPGEAWSNADPKRLRECLAEARCYLQKGDIQLDQGRHHTQITTVHPPDCQPEKGGEG